MNRDRHIQLPTGIPHGVKARIINFDQLAGRYVLSQIEPERLQDLQTFSASLVRPLNFLRLNARIVRFQKSCVAGLGESYKPARMRLVILADCLHQSSVVSPCKVYHGTKVLTVHDRKQFIWSAEI